MKKGRFTVLCICALSICFVVGVFIGRNLDNGYVDLPYNHTNSDTEISVTPSDYRLDINTATKVQLMELPGIGETIAKRIIEYREVNGFFISTDDLLNVEGIGEKKLLEIEKMITVGG